MNTTPKTNLALNLVFITFFSANAICQEAINSSIYGIVTDINKKALIGAKVIAIHTTTNTKYETMTSQNGSYSISLIRAGGPYSLEISYVGFRDINEQNISLTPNQALQYNAIMQLDALSILETMEEKDKASILSPDRTGASLNIRKELLESLPSMNRNIDDFLKFMPQSKPAYLNRSEIAGTSFTGQDVRFNNLTIDGADFNSRFGLSGITSGQTNFSPISMDAIEEIQINLAPFDVRQSDFTGAGINVITRSGINKPQGSIFFNTRSENVVGHIASGTNIVRQSYNVKQSGGRLGFPLIKDKLFLFLNYEQDSRSDPGSSFLPNTGNNTGNNVTRVLSSDLEQVVNYFKKNHNLFDSSKYNPGLYEGYSLNSKNKKGLVKMEYNIDTRNKLTTRFNFFTTTSDLPASNLGVINGNRNENLTALNFQNSNQKLTNNIFSGVTEITSILSNKVTNNFLISFVIGNDHNSQLSKQYPPFFDVLKDGSTYMSFGNGPLNLNKLNSNNWELKDDLTINKGKNVYSLGFKFEYFKFTNQFDPTLNGQYTFNSLRDFTSFGDGDSFLIRVSQPFTIPGATLPEHKVIALQPALYFQDLKSLLNDKLKLSLGIRIEIPKFINTAEANSKVESLNFRSIDGLPLTLSTSQLPKFNLLFSPRVGVNWDVRGDRSIQIRGGSGIFSCQPAFSWIGNQISNNGLYSGLYKIDSLSNYYGYQTILYNLRVHEFNPKSYNLAFTDPNFKFPQVIRTNIAVDYKLPFSILGTLEGIFSKNLNQPDFVNVNLESSKNSYSGPDNRPIYSGIGKNGLALTGELLNNALRVNDEITDAILLTNTKKGYSYSLTAQLQKEFSNNFFFSGAYNFSIAKDLMSAGTLAYSSWANEVGINGNNFPQLAYSDNDQRHRIVGALYYKRPDTYGSTGVSLSLMSASQGRISYRVNGDINGDGLSSNDLMYIPNKASDLLFEAYSVGSGSVSHVISSDAQAKAFDIFLKSNKYLSQGGRYAQRNGFLLPWLSTIDLSIIRDINFKISDKEQTIQIRADIFNFGNMINNDWGVGTIPTTVSPLQWIKKNANNQPIYRYTPIDNGLFKDTDGLPTKSTIASSTLNDVWQLQLGLRYIFN